MLLYNSLFFFSKPAHSSVILYINSSVILYINHFCPPLKITFAGWLLPAQLAKRQSFSFALGQILTEIQGLPSIISWMCCPVRSVTCFKWIKYVKSSWIARRGRKLGRCKSRYTEQQKLMCPFGLCRWSIICYLPVPVTGYVAKVWCPGLLCC